MSLVSVFHAGLRPGRNFSAGHWHVHRPRLRATTSAQGARLAHSAFVTCGIPAPCRTPPRITGSHRVLRSGSVRIAGDHSSWLTPRHIRCHIRSEGSRRRQPSSLPCFSRCGQWRPSARDWWGQARVRRVTRLTSIKAPVNTTRDVPGAHRLGGDYHHLRKWGCATLAVWVQASWLSG